MCPLASPHEVIRITIESALTMKTLFTIISSSLRWATMVSALTVVLTVSVLMLFTKIRVGQAPNYRKLRLVFVSVL